MTCLAALFVGAAIGCLYCAALWFAIALSAGRAHPIVWFGVGSLLRLVLVGSLFAALARLGAATLLAALAGLAVTRGGIAYRMRGPAGRLVPSLHTPAG